MEDNVRDGQTSEEASASRQPSVRLNWWYRQLPVILVLAGWVLLIARAALGVIAIIAAMALAVRALVLIRRAAGGKVLPVLVITSGVLGLVVGAVLALQSGSARSSQETCQAVFILLGRYAEAGDGMGQQVIVDAIGRTIAGGDDEYLKSAWARVEQGTASGDEIPNHCRAQGVDVDYWYQLLRD